MRKCWQELTEASRELNRKKYEKNQIRRDVAGSFFVVELIVTFEKPFVTGGEKDKGGGGRMRVS